VSSKTKYAVGKNKNTEALAFESSVLWFICFVSFMFITVINFCYAIFLGLQVTVSCLQKMAIFTPHVDTEKQTLFYQNVSVKSEPQLLPRPSFATVLPYST